MEGISWSSVSGAWLEIRGVGSIRGSNHRVPRSRHQARGALVLPDAVGNPIRAPKMSFVNRGDAVTLKSM